MTWLLIFSESKTKENLMRAFAGESQARNRYTPLRQSSAEEECSRSEAFFLYTADQELSTCGEILRNC